MQLARLEAARCDWDAWRRTAVTANTANNWYSLWPGTDCSALPLPHLRLLVVLDEDAARLGCSFTQELGDELDASGALKYIVRPDLCIPFGKSGIACELLAVHAPFLPWTTPWTNAHPVARERVAFAGPGKLQAWSSLTVASAVTAFLPCDVQASQAMRDMALTTPGPGVSALRNLGAKQVRAPLVLERDLPAGCRSLQRERIFLHPAVRGIRMHIMCFHTSSPSLCCRDLLCLCLPAMRGARGAACCTGMLQHQLSHSVIFSPQRLASHPFLRCGFAEKNTGGDREHAWRGLRAEPPVARPRREG